MSLDLLLGLQWGDEGKGKIVDAITPDYDIIARFQGGPNAGHTIEFDGHKHVLHTIPSGIFNKDSVNVIGNGVVIDPAIFLKEINGLKKFEIDLKNKLLISKRAHIILPTHKIIDASSEASKGKKKIGSTNLYHSSELVMVEEDPNQKTLNLVEGCPTLKTHQEFSLIPQRTFLIDWINTRVIWRHGWVSFILNFTGAL